MQTGLDKVGGQARTIDVAQDGGKRQDFMRQETDGLLHEACTRGHRRVWERMRGRRETTTTLHTRKTHARSGYCFVLAALGEIQPPLVMHVRRFQTSSRDRGADTMKERNDGWVIEEPKVTRHQDKRRNLAKVISLVHAFAWARTRLHVQDRVLRSH